MAALALCLTGPPASAQTGWGSALQFDGVDDYVSVNAGVVLSNRSFSVEFWAQRGDSSTADQWIMGQGIGAASQGLHIGFRQNKMLFGFYANDLLSTNIITDVQWHHWSLTYNATNNQRRILRDGMLEIEGSASGPFQGSGVLWLGSSPVPGHYKGSLDEVRIWNVARSHADITNHMFQPLTGAEPGLVAYYRFNEAAGLTAYDATTNHLDATLVNGPTWVLSAVPVPFTYMTNAGTITITGYTGPGGAVTIPDAIGGLPVTSIGAYAFYDCTSLTSVTIPDSVTSIGDGAFQGCIGLTSVTIGNSVTSIREGAFSYCTSLTSVTIPDSVTSIGAWAFESCTSLTSVTIGNSVTSIGAGAFYSCTSLMAITVDTNNPAYSSVDGVLFSQSQTTLIQCPGGKAGSYTIPESVTSIGDGAFSSCTSLTSVTIPDSVTSIGGYAFADCTSLTGVYFLGNAPSLGSDVFYNANNATVYYLAGATGWYTPFGGRPAVLWNAQVQTGDPTFGVRTNRFGFSITGTANIPIVVEGCTNLASALWTPLQTCTVTNGAVYFCDEQWTNHPARYYRIRWP